MPPKTKMTPEQVEQSLRENQREGIKTGEYISPHSVRHPGSNRDLTRTVPKASSATED